MKKIITFILVALFSLSLIGCDDSSKTEEVGKSYVSLGINPNIELIVDENNKVLEVYAVNEDAKVLLYEEKDLVGMDFDAALKIITNLSIEYGYLEENNKVINFSVSSTLNEDYQTSLKATIKAAMTEEALKEGLSIYLTAEGAFTLVRELEQLKTENPENKLIQELTIEKFQLITSAQSSDDTLSLEVAVTLNEEELMNRISSARDELYNIATAKFNELVVESKQAYAKTLNNFNRSVYATYYAKDVSMIMSHPVNYGALYSMYGMAADSLSSILKVIEVVENYKNNLLSDEQIDLVVASITSLSIASDIVKEGIKNSEGNVTIASVNAYLDKLIKNINSEQLKVEIENIKTTVNQIEQTVKNECAKLQEKYQSQITKMLVILEATYDTVSSSLEMLPEKLKETCNIYLSEIQMMISTMKQALEGDISVEVIKEWRDSFKAKEMELLNKINSDLTEEELAEIKKIQEKVSTELQNTKKKLEEDINSALVTIKSELETIKSQRTNKK